MSTEYTYKYSRAAVGYLAEIFDPSGKKLAEAIGLDTGGVAKIKAIKEKSYLLSEYKSGTYIKVLYPEMKVYRVTPEDELWMYAKPQIQRLLKKDMSSVIQLQNRALSKLYPN